MSPGLAPALNLHEHVFTQHPRECGCSLLSSPTMHFPEEQLEESIWNETQIRYLKHCHLSERHRAGARIARPSTPWWWSVVLPHLICRDCPPAPRPSVRLYILGSGCPWISQDSLLHCGHSCPIIFACLFPSQYANLSLNVTSSESLRGSPALNSCRARPLP